MPALELRLREARDRAGLTQAQLAERAGISRQALVGIERGRIVPSTLIALNLARVLRARVEDLFQLPGTDDPPRVSVTVAGAPSDRLLVPGRRAIVASVRGQLVAHALPSADTAAFSFPAAGVVARRTKHRAEISLFEGEETFGDVVVLAGCAPALALLARRVEAHANVRCVWVPATSANALAWLGRGHAHVAGAHLFDDATGEFNRSFAARSLGRRSGLLVNLARWSAGLVTGAHNPRGIQSAADAARDDVRFVAREPGSGADRLLARALRSAGTKRRPRAALTARGHLEVAQAVAMGAADVGVAVESAALAYELGFIPLAEERFDLAIPADLVADPRVARVLDTLASGAFRKELASLGGYDNRDTGSARELAGGS